MAIQIDKKKVFAFMVLPGLKPRIQELFGTGFQIIPYLMALVYQLVRLLPDGHPYLNPQNMGKFGIRHVIAEAANNLVISKNNIDQILLFVTILIGLVLMILQCGLLVFSLFVNPVLAATMPTSFAGFFIPQNPQQDLAYIFLDLVFGVPDIFNSCVAIGADCGILYSGAPNGTATTAGGDGIADPWVVPGMTWPFPIHYALHSILSVYSTGLVVVGAFITLYFIIVVIAETAQTGTAFGKRFNKVWAPVRLVVAFGLLIPLGSGLSSSQYIVLYAAKFGSGFASNGWKVFNQELQVSYNVFGNKESLVVEPQKPDPVSVLQFMFAASTCREIELIKNNRVIQPYLVKDSLSATKNLPLDQFFAGNTVNSGNFENAYTKLLQFADGSTKVPLRFGYIGNQSESAGKAGQVTPVCGEISIPLIDARDPTKATNINKASIILQRYYFFSIIELWYRTFNGNLPPPAINDQGDLPNTVDPLRLNYPRLYVCKQIPNQTYCPSNREYTLPSAKYRSAVYEFYKKDLDAVLNDPSSQQLSGYVGSSIGAIKEQINSDQWLGSQAMLFEKGWAGAGLWYNKVAEMNGGLVAAVFTPPAVVNWPQEMESVLEYNLKNLQSIDLKKRFEPSIKMFMFGTPGGPRVVDKKDPFIFWDSFNFWQDSSNNTPEANPFVDAIKTFLGTEGLFNMRENDGKHPMAKLVGVGRAFINSAISNFGDAAALSLLNAAVTGSQGLTTITGFMMTIITIGLTAGFTLYYVLPFLPFMYFFFAIGGWLKGIFEGVVGAPLWALAHLRIDGNGLSGQAAISGYFLIFEIFLRPILAVFGLIASISIFSALVSVMNDTWGLVTSNLAGYDATTNATSTAAQAIEFVRGPIDQFFFTVIYTILVYIMAMSSFKMIDLVPNNILRWIGQSVSTFNDEGESPAEGLSGKATVGAQQTIGSLTGGGGVGDVLKSISSRGKGG